MYHSYSVMDFMSSESIWSTIWIILYSYDTINWL